jgi:hypothetical protein
MGLMVSWSQSSREYFTGHLIEKSLAMDHVCVIADHMPDIANNPLLPSLEAKAQENHPSQKLMSPCTQAAHAAAPLGVHSPH